MNVLTIFEQRIGAIFLEEAPAERKPFSFRRLAKRAVREMEDETFVIDGVDTAPALYTVLVSTRDDEVMRPLYVRITDEISQLIEAQAKKRGYTFVGRPLVRFMVDPALRRGRFSVFAENIDPRTLARLRDEENAYLGVAPAHEIIVEQGYDASLEAEPAINPLFVHEEEFEQVPNAAEVPATDNDFGADDLALQDNLPQEMPEATPSPHDDEPAEAQEVPDVDDLDAEELAAEAEVETNAVEEAVVATTDDAAAEAALASLDLAEGSVAATPNDLPNGLDDIDQVEGNFEPLDNFVLEEPYEPEPEVAPAPQPQVAPAAQEGPAPVFADEDFDEDVSNEVLEELFDLYEPAEAPQAAASQPVAPHVPEPAVVPIPQEVAPAQVRQVFADDSLRDAPSPQSARCTLVDLATNRTYAIDNPRTPVGRERSLGAVVLTDPNVSRRHAELVFDGSVWRIRDLDSTNGTLVNNIDVREAILHNRDILTIGLTNLEFRAG